MFLLQNQIQINVERMNIREQKIKEPIFLV